jgi:MFS family permease
MEEKKITYKDIWKIPNCRRLIFSNLINRLGDSIDAIAFTWLVYQITGSAAWSALIFGLNQLPSIFVQPLAGPLVEGKNKKKIVIFTDVLRGLIISSFVIMYYLNLVTPYIMAGFTLLITTVESFNLPASSAFVPELIDEEHFVTATSLNLTVSKIFELIGMGVAGIIIAGLGVGAAMLIDASTFLIGAIIISTIEYHGCKLKDESIKEQSYHTKLREGIKYLFKNSTVLYFCSLCVLINFIFTPLNSFLAPITSEVYGMNSAFLSFCTMTLSGATIISSIVMPKIINRFSFDTLAGSLGIVMGLGCFILTLGDNIRGNIPACYILGGSCFAILGFSSGLLSSCLNVTFVREVDSDYLARIGAVFNAIALASAPVATFIVSILSTTLDVGTITGGFGLAGAAIMGTVCLIQHIKNKEEEIANET